jgi:hypothetical protein
MEQKLFLIAIVLTLSLVLLMVYKTYSIEGFESLELKVQDRTNPIASQQNPLKNPAAPIGISEAQANKLRLVSAYALNSPTAVPTGTGSFTQEYSDSINTPRIDNENSFLGLVKFCKDNGKGNNPFGDPKFAENCGMCLSSGSLITGETFTTPTGVVVYGKDKEKAYKMRTNNKYKFPRTLPSLNAAICKGSSMSDNALPVLALNSNDFIRFKKREACIHGKTVGNQCGKCLSNNKFSWVDPQGGIQPLSFILYGMGKANVRVGSQKQTVDLSETQGAPINIGRVLEGTPFQIEVIKGTTVEGPYIYGAMIGTNPNGKPYRIALEKLVEKDSITGSTPRRGTSKLFADVRMNLIQLLPKPMSDRMMLDGQIPLTFVEPDQLASFDCDSSPFMTNPESHSLLTSDPCARPKGQKPGNYSVTCLQEAVLEGKCSADGEYYKNPKEYAQNMSLGQFTTWIQGQKNKTEDDVDIASKCLGKDISTPCDNFLKNPNAIPDKKCLVYLYKNTGSANKRIGTSYSTSLGLSSLTNSQAGSVNPQFCQASGTMNPETPQGDSELTLIAQGYQGRRGIEAVKQYLRDTFNKATSNLDANKTDTEGGKKTSWEKCFGVRIADPRISLTQVNKNAQGTVQNIPKCNNNTFPATWRPQRNRILQNNFFQSGNYELSFKINPRSAPGNWANIFHVSNGRDCCNFGNRAPGIWLHPNRFLHVRIGSNRDGNWGFDSQPIPLNQVTTFRLRCVGTEVICTVNERVFTFTQPGVRPSGRFTVWGSDPWYMPADCDLSEFCFTIL